MRLIKLKLSPTDRDRFKKFVKNDKDITKRKYREKRLDHLLDGKSDPYIDLQFLIISRVDGDPILKIGEDYAEHLCGFKTLEDLIEDVIDFKFYYPFNPEFINVL